MRIFYIDDSGDESVAVLAAVTFEIEAWGLVLKEWLGWRKWMWKQSGPIGGEVHEPAISSTVGLRKEAYRRSLAQINRQEEVAVLGVALEERRSPRPTSDSSPSSTSCWPTAERRR